MTPLSEIEAYFKTNPPTKCVKIAVGQTIINPAKFVEGHIAILKSHPTKDNPKNKVFMPYYERLRDYYLYCKEGKHPVIEKLDYQAIRKELKIK